MANVIEFTLKARDNASKTMVRIAKTVARVAKVTAALAAAALAAATAVFVFAKRIANVQDAAGKMALKIGKSVEELTKLQFAAKLSGVRVETFNMAVQRMQRRLGEAAKGTGEALGALRDLGINAKEFVKVPLDKQLEVLADKFANMSDGTEALRTAFKLFDSEGVVMLQLLKKGSPAMQSMADAAERFGLVVSQQAAANAEKFNDTITMLQGSIEGAGRSIGNALIPMITGMAEKFTSFVSDNKDGMIKFFEDMILGAVTFGIMASVAFDSVKATLQSVFDGSIFDNFLGNAGNMLTSFASMAGPTAQAFANTLLAGFTVLWDGFLSLGRSAASIIVNDGATMALTYVKIVLGTFKLLWDGFLSLGKGAWSTIKNIFSNDPPKPIMGTIFANLDKDTAQSRANIGGLFDDLKGTALPAISGIFDNLKKDTAFAKKTLSITLNDLKTESVKLGGGIVDGVSEGLVKSMANAGAAAKEMIAGVTAANADVQASNEDTLSNTSVFLATFTGLYEQFMAANKTLAEQLASEVFGILQNSIAGIGDAVGNAIVMGQNLLESIKNVALQAASAVISMLVQIGIQRLIAAAIGKKASASEGASEIGTKSAIAYANGFNASAALGIVGLAAAPAVGAAASATMLAGAAGAGAAGAGVGGSIAALHGGLDFVPSEQTALLDRGERIVSPGQNRDLTSFLDGGGGGGGTTVNIASISILPNATNAEALLNMAPEDMQRVVEDKIIRALDDLNRIGTRPEAAT